jgi:ATP-dependent helicase/nuclease subunit B
VDNGFAPQLPLEAWLAAQGAFSGCTACEVSELVFARLSGGLVPGEIRVAGKQSPGASAAAAHSGLLQLLRDYASPLTSYVALDTGQDYCEPGDAHHLARTREWLYSSAEGEP